MVKIIETNISFVNTKLLYCFCNCSFTLFISPTSILNIAISSFFYIYYTRNKQRQKSTKKKDGFFNDSSFKIVVFKHNTLLKLASNNPPREQINTL